MKKNIILVILPGLFVMAIIIFAALDGWGSRDYDSALALFMAAFCFGLATSIFYKNLKSQSNKESSEGEVQNSSRLKNGLFHTLFSAVSLFVITSSFLIYGNIQYRIKTEPCRVHMCAALVQYDAQYPMHKTPEELFLLAQQNPLDVDHVKNKIMPNLEGEDQYIDGLTENPGAEKLYCSRDVYRLQSAMSTLRFYKEIWLNNLLEKNREKNLYETEIEEDSIFEVTGSDESDEAPKSHYSQQAALDEYNKINEYRAALSCD